MDLKDNRLSEAELYRAIGGIDDSYVTEAMNYRAAHKKAPSLLLRGLAAAAVLLVISFALRVLPLTPPAVDPGPDGSGNHASPPRYVWAATSSYAQNTAFLSTMSELIPKAETTSTLPTLTDGIARIIWLDSDGTYYAFRLERMKDSDKEELLRLLTKHSPASVVSPSAERPPCSVWISFGDGSAFTPYLPYTEGTVSYGTLAEYQPELLPSEDLMAFLLRLIEKE